MVIYDAKHRRVETVDSRETAPQGMASDALAGFNSTTQFQEVRAGGLSVGVPGTVRGWETALKRYGTKRLSSLLRPAEKIGRKGFRIDETFNQQVTDNADLFDDFTPSRELYLTPELTAKPVDDVQRNPDMARDLRAHRRGPGQLLRGPDRPRHRADGPAPAGRSRAPTARTRSTPGS